VVFEDDWKAAYAYLRDPAKSIVSDVWLYNAKDTPETPEWPDRTKMPYANPKGFALDEPPPVVQRPEDVTVTWIGDGTQLDHADVKLNGLLYGRLAPGAKPGWAKLAGREGPLALPLERPE
jgi:hypothetical protein